MSRVISLIFFIYICFSSSVDFAQSKQSLHLIDSLANCNVQNNDSMQVEIWNEICLVYTRSGYKDSSEHYANKALSLAKEINYQKGIADAYILLGKITINNYGPRDVSTKYYLQALEIYSKIKDQRGIANSNMQLGVVSFDMQNYSDAVQYLNIADQNTPKNNSSTATIHYLLALCYSELKQFALAKNMFDLASTEFGTNNIDAQLQINVFRGKMYANMGDNQHAISYLHGTVNEFQSKLDSISLVPAYSFLSSAYLNIANYKNAISYGRIVYQLSKDNGGYLTYLRETEENLHKAYSKIGKIDSAYYFLSNLNSIKDSITSNSTLQRIAELKGKYEFEQEMKAKKAEQDLKDAIASQKLEREKLLRNLSLLGFFLVMIFAGLIFKQHNKIKKEKRRSDELLLNILPAETAEELKSKGIAEAKHFDSVTVIFTDFIGFTEISVHLSPSELVKEIHGYFSTFDSIIEKYNIEKIKTIGDAYMAVGGLPIPSTSSIKNAVLAGLEMQEFIIEKNKSQIKEGKPAFGMRVGMHTGAVVAGIVGVKKFQYDIWGDTVNTANRIESAGELNKVNISQSTYEFIKNEPDLNFESRGKLKAKGKGEIDMWFVYKK